MRGWSSGEENPAVGARFGGPRKGEERHSLPHLSDVELGSSDVSIRVRQLQYGRDCGISRKIRVWRACEIPRIFDGDIYFITKC